MSKRLLLLYRGLSLFDQRKRVDGGETGKILSFSLSSSSMCMAKQLSSCWASFPLHGSGYTPQVLPAGYYYAETVGRKKERKREKCWRQEAIECDSKEKQMKRPAALVTSAFYYSQRSARSSLKFDSGTEGDARHCCPSL